MRRLRLLLVSTLFVLVACQSPAESSLSNDSGTSSSCTGTSSVSSQVEEPEKDLELTAENVLNTITNAVSSRNYSIYQKQLAHAASYTYINDRYYYASDTNAGYVALESFDSSYTNSNELIYSVTYENKAIVLGSPLLDGNLYVAGDPYTNLDSFNPMLALKGKTISASAFTIDKATQTLVTTNQDLLTAFATLTGHAADAAKGHYYRVRFTKISEKHLYFVLQTFDDSYQVVDAEDTSAILQNIGQSSFVPLENYLKDHYHLPSNTLSEDAISPLVFQSDDDVISLDNHSEMWLNGAKEEGGVLAAEKVNRSRNRYELTTMDLDADTTRVSLAENHTDRAPTYIGLNANNEVIEENFTSYSTWDSRFPPIEGILVPERKAFRQIGDNQYRYYGWNKSSFFASLSQLNGRNSIQNVDIFTKDGKVNEIVFTYPTMKDVDKDGKSFTYDVTIYADVVADRPIMDVKPYATRPFHNVLEKAFARFDGSAPFQVTAQDDRTAAIQYTTYYDGNHLLYKNAYYTGAGNTSYTRGYTKTGDNAYRRFLIDRKGNLKANGAEVNASLRSLLTFSLSPDLFRKVKDGVYEFDSYVLPSVRDGMILGTESNLFVPSSFRLTVDETKGYVTSATYSYTDNLFHSGSETLTFLYGDDVKLSSMTSLDIDALPEWKEPTSWGDEGTTFTNYLTRYFGDEAANVPYVYDPDIYGLWDAMDSTLELEFYSNTYTADADSFYAAYAAALKAASFEETTLSGMPGATIYVKGKISIRMAKVLRGGIYFWETGAQK